MRVKISQTDNQIIINSGGLFSKLTGSRNVTITKGGDVSVSGTGFFGKQLEPVTFPAASIVSVRLDTYQNGSYGNSVSNNSSFTVHNSGQNSSRASRLYLVLNNNDMVEIASKQNMGGLKINGMDIGSLIQKAPLSKEASQVADFLGVPLNAEDNSSLAGVVRSIGDTLRQGLEGQAPSPTQTAAPAQATAPAQSVVPDQAYTQAPVKQTTPADQSPTPPTNPAPPTTPTTP